MSSYQAEQPWTPFLNDTFAGPASGREMHSGLASPECRPLPWTRVAVVGAGLAGLHAAWLLQQQGVAVTVYEASGRLGGRVLSSRDFAPGTIVEAGAELIGTNHPTWQSLATRFGLTLEKIAGDSDERIRFADHELSRQELADLKSDRGTVLQAIGQQASVIDQAEPWRSPDAAALDNRTVSDALDAIFRTVSLRNREFTRRYLDLIIGNDTNAPPDKLSYLGLLSKVSAGRMGTDMLGYWGCTETHRCVGGSAQLTDKLAGPLGSNVRLNWPVSIVSIRPDDIRVTSCRTGGTYSQDFDYVILAAPTGCWPQIESPVPFPRSAYTMADGPAVKFFSLFDKAFSGLSPDARWDKLGQVWQTRFWAAPGRHQDTQFGLTVYAGGTFVRDKGHYVTCLNTLYPGYDKHVTKQMLADWKNTMWIGTGYSTPAPGQVTTVGQNLSLPFAGRLYFAGEHACVPFHGYMEGALQSGARAASSIVAAICAPGDRSRLATTVAAGAEAGA